MDGFDEAPQTAQKKKELRPHLGAGLLPLSTVKKNGRTSRKILKRSNIITIIFRTVLHLVGKGEVQTPPPPQPGHLPGALNNENSNREIAWVLLLVSKPERAGLLVWGKKK